ncbi:MAG: hypothetical protein Q9188_005626 [Gyalolechia gomerana]
MLDNQESRYPLDLEGFYGNPIRAQAQARRNLYIAPRVRGWGPKHSGCAPAKLMLALEYTPVVELTCERYDGPGENVKKKNLFNVDYCFPSDSGSDLLFQTLQYFPLRKNGQNICIIADGQSNTGKSYTMFEGPEALIPSTTHYSFGHVHNLRENKNVDVKCSIVRYGLTGIKDLINEGKKVDGLWPRPVRAEDETLAILKEAWPRRTGHLTQKNPTNSSRGHFLYVLQFEGYMSGKSKVVKWGECLVDLAGSEELDTNDSKAEDQRETEFVNSSRLDLCRNLVARVKDTEYSEVSKDPKVS